MARARTRRRGKSSPWKGTIRMVVVFGVLLAVNAYAFIFRKGTSLSALLAAARSQPVAAAVPTKGAPEGPGGRAKGEGKGKGKADEPSFRALAANTTAPPRAPAAGQAAVGPAAAPAAVTLLPQFSDEGRLETGSFGSGETLLAVLRRAGVPAPTQTEVASALRPVFAPEKLQAGHEYALRFDAEEHLRSLELRVGPQRLVRLERGGGARDGLRASVDTAKQELRISAGGAMLGGSLYEATQRAGEGPELAARIADALAARADLLVEGQPTDRVRWVVEKVYEGAAFKRYGRLLGVQLDTKGGTVARGFWFSPRPGSADFYGEEGSSLSSSPLRGPLRCVRLPDGFDRKRLHPVTRTEQGRNGSEWGAPAGTPVWATTFGRVVFRGKRNADGETVVIRDAGGMETVYAHLKSIARGLAEGQEVRQRQVIGYVGSSGLAPGAPPRLHYTVRVGGHALDAARINPVRRPPVPEVDRERFQQAVAPLAAMMDEVRIEALPKAGARR